MESGHDHRRRKDEARNDVSQRLAVPAFALGMVLLRSVREIRPKAFRSRDPGPARH